MTKNFVTIADTCLQMSKKMEKNKIFTLIVMNEKFVGVISMHDLRS